MSKTLDRLICRIRMDRRLFNDPISRAAVLFCIALGELETSGD
jgi:hypothetical protein